MFISQASLFIKLINILLLLLGFGLIIYIIFQPSTIRSQITDTKLDAIVYQLQSNPRLLITPDICQQYQSITNLIILNTGYPETDFSSFLATYAKSEQLNKVVSPIYTNNSDFRLFTTLPLAGYDYLDIPNQDHNISIVIDTQKCNLSLNWSNRYEP